MNINIDEILSELYERYNELKANYDMEVRAQWTLFADLHYREMQGLEYAINLLESKKK